MTTSTRRPSWKKKRWIAALALWLLIAYPASFIPAAYCLGRGWLPFEEGLTAYRPVIELGYAIGGPAAAYVTFADRCYRRGIADSTPH